MQDKKRKSRKHPVKWQKVREINTRSTDPYWDFVASHSRVDINGGYLEDVQANPDMLGEEETREDCQERNYGRRTLTKDWAYKPQQGRDY